MRLLRRLAGAILAMLIRLGPARPAEGDRADRDGFSTHPGGKGLRFTNRLRDAFRRRWLKVKR